MKVQFITRRKVTTNGFYKTYNFKTASDGWDFLAKYGIDHLVIDIIYF